MAIRKCIHAEETVSKETNRGHLILNLFHRWIKMSQPV